MLLELRISCGLSVCQVGIIHTVIVRRLERSDLMLVHSHIEDHLCEIGAGERTSKFVYTFPGGFDWLLFNIELREFFILITLSSKRFLNKRMVRRMFGLLQIQLAKIHSDLLFVKLLIGVGWMLVASLLVITGLVNGIFPEEYRWILTTLITISRVNLSNDFNLSDTLIFKVAVITMRTTVDGRLFRIVWLLVGLVKWCFYNNDIS